MVQTWQKKDGGLLHFIKNQTHKLQRKLNVLCVLSLLPPKSTACHMMKKTIYIYSNLLIHEKHCKIVKQCTADFLEETTHHMDY